MARRDQRPSKTEITKVLLESKFDPRTKSPMGVVTEIADARYCVMKAIEVLHSLDLNRIGKDFHDEIAKAISLLALARVKHNGPTETKKDQT